jgi:hypothetical protein
MRVRLPASRLSPVTVSVAVSMAAIVAVSLAVSAAPGAAQPMLSGRYEAMSTTAMSITGDLTVDAASLTCALDQTYGTKPVGRVAATQDYAKGAGSWATLLGVPASLEVELREVAVEKVGKKAPNGGLCAPAKTTFLALVRTLEPGSAPGTRRITGLRLAAFKGAQAPGPDGGETDLCGTFNYTAASGKTKANK